MAVLDVPGILCLMCTSLRIAHITSDSSWSDLNHTQSAWSGQDHTGHTGLNQTAETSFGFFMSTLKALFPGSTQ